MTRRDREVVLLIEDDPIARTMAGQYLSRHDYEVLEAANCADARQMIASMDVDLVLVDIRLPDGSGMDLAREIRQASDVGLIFMTQMGDTENRVRGLEIGADDYVTKPVDLRELLARVRSTLRRVHKPSVANADGVVVLGPWEIDLRRREAVTTGGRIAPLTRAEFDLVAALVQAGGRPVSRDYLLDVVSHRSEVIGDRTVDTLIGRIRRKLETEGVDRTLIVTERGIGYRANLGD